MDGGICAKVKVVLGAVGSGPIVLEAVEHRFHRRILSEELIEEAGALARTSAKPVANTATAPGYRRDMAGFLTKIALRETLR